MGYGTNLEFDAMHVMVLSIHSRVFYKMSKNIWVIAWNLQQCLCKYQVGINIGINS